MSKEAIIDFIDKAMNDSGFQTRLKSDPEGALNQFDLSDDEKAAIRSGSEDQLKSMGLDERLSKFGSTGGWF